VGAENEIVLHPFTWGEIDELRLSEERQLFQHKFEARCRGFVKGYVVAAMQQNTYIFLSTCFTRIQIVSGDKLNKFRLLTLILKEFKMNPDKGLGLRSRYY
jgi:hypothetical protein